MKYNLTVVCLFILFLHSDAISQNAKLQDVVYLKNGSIIHGTIIEEVPNKSVKIETRDGDIFVYQMDEIEKITKTPYHQREIRDDAEPTNDADEGYSGYILLGISEIVSPGSQTLPTLHFVNGFHNSPSSTLGIGVGLEIESESERTLILPVWIDARAFIGDRDTRAFVSAKLGYSFGYTDRYGLMSEGLCVGAGPGVQFRLSPGFSLLLDAGYKLQWMASGNYGAIDIHFGIGF